MDYKNFAFLQVLENIDEGIVIVDEDRIEYINSPIAGALKYKTKDLINQFFKNISNICVSDLDNNKSIKGDFISKDGIIQSFKINKILNYNSKNILIINLCDKVCEIKKEFLESESRNKAFLNSIPDLMFRISRDGIFLDCIANKPEKLYVKPDDFIGKSLYEVLPLSLADTTFKYVNAALHSGETQFYEYIMNINNKEAYYESRIFQSGENEIISLVRDITYNKNIELKLKYLSIHDDMTGLFNRSYFEEKLSFFNNNKEIPVGIVFCDVNGLKLANETLGHDYGDRLLVQTANILKQVFHKDDIISRMGGDEFAVLVRKCTPLIMEQYRERILDLCKDDGNDNNFQLNISIGFSVRLSPDTPMSEVYKEADNNMNKHKLLQNLSNRSSIVQGLSKTLQARDFCTESHAERLEGYMVLLAERLQLAEQRVNDMRLFAKFHDLGKIGIPDNILLKPGALNTEERKEIQRHSEIGYRIAVSVPDLAHIAEWILKHHEWYNGKGYPLGLSGEQIPLECRILSVVDAYDAMTSNRPYRLGMPKAIAEGELKKFAGSQFDPFIVNSFIGIIEKESEA